MATKLIRYIENGEQFVWAGNTYRVHATFMEGFGHTRLVVTQTAPFYVRMPQDLTLSNMTAVEIPE